METNTFYEENSAENLIKPSISFADRKIWLE